MSVPAAEDFGDIAKRLKEIEAEKAKVLETPLPEVKPDFSSLLGAPIYQADYDPA